MVGTGLGRRMRIWDLPVRLFHWLLVLLVGSAWWTAEEHLIGPHRLIGYTILTLVVFRLAWGFWGSTTARFSHFVRGPGGVASYIGNDLFRRGTVSGPGHNPLGGWSVIAMLALLLAQPLLGLFAIDVDGLESGPFAHFVSFDTGRWAAETHELVFNLLMVVIALHVLAILFYRVFKGENLVSSMFTGSRDASGDAAGLRFVSPGLALLLVVAVGVIVWLLVAGFGQT